MDTRVREVTKFRQLKIIGITAVLAISSLSNGQEAQLTAAEIDQMVIDLSNWGRWGTNDQLGTLNFITKDKRRSAATLVTIGTSVSMAQTLLTAAPLKVVGGTGSPLNAIATF